MSRTRFALLCVTAGFYVAIVAAVWGTTGLVHLDWQVMLFRPYKQWPEIHAFLDYYVVFGQRGPTAVLISAWLGWRCWRQRTLRPLLVLVTALFLLNATVGAAKLGMAREGPHYATAMGSNEMWAAGDIFPSGHVANAVVTWGILAYLATTPRVRRTLSILAAVFSLSIGATTVYIGTHWVSDVLLGWAAGLLILLGLPWCEPLIAAVERRLLALWGRLRLVRRVPERPTAEPSREVAPRPVPAAARHGEEPLPRGEPAVAGARGGAAARLPAGRPRQPGRPPHQSRAVRPMGGR
jgi:membrane-associated phospholipid phosphatase